MLAVVVLVVAPLPSHDILAGKKPSVLVAGVATTTGTIPPAVVTSGIDFERTVEPAAIFVTTPSGVVVVVVFLVVTLIVAEEILPRSALV